jgi:hypothetical protein
MLHAADHPRRLHCIQWLWKLHVWSTGRIFNALEFFMLCSRAAQVLCTLNWKHWSWCLLEFFLSFFSSSCVLFHTLISECDCTSLQCFYKRCIHSNQQLALSPLMHSIHCSSTVSIPRAWKKMAQETLIGCVGLHNKKFKVIEHLPGM